MNALSATPARPILFSGAMVRAILAGTKTQTRRIMKPQPYSNGFGTRPGSYEIACHNDYLPPSVMLWDVKRFGRRVYTASNAEGWENDCPYGVAGDLCWVRETWANEEQFGGYVYRADHAGDDPIGDGWRPSIHMPRVASRLTLQIADVRVQRVQDISKADVIAEGIANRAGYPIEGVVAGWHEPFAQLWDSINGKRPGADWDANPYVWALTFKAHHCNVDSMAKAAA